MYIKCIIVHMMQNPIALDINSYTPDIPSIPVNVDVLGHCLILYHYCGGRGRWWPTSQYDSFYSNHKCSVTNTRHAAYYTIGGLGK